MSTKKLAINSRFKQFLSNLKETNLKSKQFLSILLSWSISLITFAFMLSISTNKIYQLFLLINLIFTFKLINEIHKKLNPPVEMLLIFFLIILQLINIIKNISPEPGIFLTFLQIIMLSFAVLIFSLFLVQNSGGKKRDIVWFVIFGFIGKPILLGGNSYYIFLFQALLFLVLLRKTKWLEELTKTECWLYLIIIVSVFRIVDITNAVDDFFVNEFARTTIWYTLPYYLYILFKIYLLALLIKIPIVLIYNHARLSRKLQISTLFQSTFPLLIQLIMLLLIFHFFLSGWQAENLRKSIHNTLLQVKNGTIDFSIQHYKFSITNDRLPSLRLENYETLNLTRQIPQMGVFGIKQQNINHPKFDYFIFSKYYEANNSFLHLVKIDSAFLKALSENLRIMAGTSMLVRPLIPAKLVTYIYKLDFIYQSDRYIQIYPFTLIPYDGRPHVSISLESEKNDYKPSKSNFNLSIFGQKQFAFGRVFIHKWGPNSSSNRYLAFDIIMDIQPESMWTGLPTIIMFLVLVYFLVNSFIIRRVVKLGSQINRMIVQKFNQLKNGINQISTGNLDYKIKLGGEDEFVELADRFNQMGDRLKQTIAEAREKDRLQYELRIAREVQLSLLPLKLPEIAGFQISASLKTATEVGGDFYDILPLDDNRFLFTIGDVSGKGSSAAFYMAQCMSLIRFSKQFTSEPDKICLRLNDYFATSITDRQIFVTAILGILDINSNTIQFVRAGHTEPFFIPGNKNELIRNLQTKGLGIGLTKNSNTFENSLKLFQITLQAGDTLLFYTDGVIEAGRRYPGRDDEIEMYSEDRLKNLLFKTREKSATEILKKIEIDIETFYAGQPRIDDHTLLIIQRSNRDDNMDS